MTTTATFSFVPPSNPAGLDFLRRSQEHIRTMTRAERRVWLTARLGSLRQARPSDRFNAFDLSALIMTLEDWATELEQETAQ